jgi:hypothetical protein
MDDYGPVDLRWVPSRMIMTDSGAAFRTVLHGNRVLMQQALISPECGSGSCSSIATATRATVSERRGSGWVSLSPVSSSALLPPSIKSAHHPSVSIPSRRPSHLHPPLPTCSLPALRTVFGLEKKAPERVVHARHGECALAA